MKVHILEANTRKARSPICNCFNIGTSFGPPHSSESKSKNFQALSTRSAVLGTRSRNIYQFYRHFATDSAMLELRAE